MGHLGKCLVYILSLYVFGMVIVKHCGQTQIATFLSGLLGYKFGTIKQRLREFTYEAERKQGRNRQEVDVSTCFAPLLQWVLSKFRGENRQLVLAIDATYLPDAQAVTDAQGEWRKDAYGHYIFDKYWSEQTDMSRYTDPNHLDFWQPDYLKQEHDGFVPNWVKDE